MSAAAFPAHSVSTVWPLVSSDWWLSLSLARGWPVAVTISCVLLMTVAYAVAMCVLREPERRVGRKSKKALKRVLRRYNTGEERLLEETEESIPDWSTVERQLQNEGYNVHLHARSYNSSLISQRFSKAPFDQGRA